MRKTVRLLALVLVLLVSTYFGGFYLAHWINDVLVAPGMIEWLLRVVHWLVDYFAPAVHEPDDIEALYLFALLLICWVSVLACLLISLAIIARRRSRQR